MRRNYFFTSARPQSLSWPEGARAASSGAQSKNYTGAAAYRAMRRTRQEPCVWQTGLAARPCSRFFVLGHWIFDLLRGARANRSGGPCANCPWSRPAKPPAGRTSGRSSAPWPMKTQSKDPCHTSRPPFAPRQGSPRLEPTPRSASARLPNALLWHQATRLPIRRLLVPQCSLNITAGYARAAARALLLTNKVG